jgi:hypothetical protein
VEGRRFSFSAVMSRVVAFAAVRVGVSATSSRICDMQKGHQWPRKSAEGLAKEVFGERKIWGHTEDKEIVRAFEEGLELFERTGGHLVSTWRRRSENEDGSWFADAAIPSRRISSGL